MTSTETVPAKYPATLKQASLIAKLSAERECSEGFRERVTHAIFAGTLEKKKASEIIDWLWNRPKRVESQRIQTTVDALEQTAKPYPSVTAGYYATESRTGHNDLDFWRVDRPTEGKWAGKTFVKRVIGGRADCDVRGKEARTALEQILADGEATAAVLYGKEIGKCYCCNHRLTDKLSRALGIGPVCRKESKGFAATYTPAVVAAAVLSLEEVLS
jgi:hypothetical protein